MAYTSHGHHIPGTLKGEGVTKANNVARCGAFLTGCKVCMADAEAYKATFGTGVIQTEKAKQIVKDYIDMLYTSKSENSPNDLPAYEILLVWFAKTLKDWRAVITTTLVDGMIYEVMYDGEKNETSLKAYHEIQNMVISD